jgi:hypothetical protein
MLGVPLHEERIIRIRSATIMYDTGMIDPHDFCLGYVQETVLHKIVN